jgi:hypothetical protein
MHTENKKSACEVDCGGNNLYYFLVSVCIPCFREHVEAKNISLEPEIGIR